MLRLGRVLLQNVVRAAPQLGAASREMGTATAAPPAVWQLGKLNHVAIAASIYVATNVCCFDKP